MSSVTIWHELEIQKWFDFGYNLWSPTRFTEEPSKKGFSVRLKFSQAFAVIYWTPFSGA